MKHHCIYLKPHSIPLDIITYTQIFVCVVWVLISGIVWGWYAVLRPYLAHTEGTVGLILHAIFGHWLLINVCYHYYKGSTKPPG